MKDNSNRTPSTRKRTRRAATRRPRAELDFARPPASFFSSDGLLVEQLCEEIEKIGAIASGPHGELYFYEDGVWRPNADRVIGDRCRKLLGDRFRTSHINNAIKWFSVRPSLFSTEQQTRYLNLPNGLLDWRTGELLPHDPDAGRIPRVPVEWDPEATCPKIEDWLNDVLPEDCHELAFEAFGYLLYAGNPLHKALMLHGAGRNGKGTFIRLARALVGSENTAEIAPQDLDDNRFAVASLYGKLANLIGDVNAKTFKMTARFKQITGEDVISAELKHQNAFSFQSFAFNIASFNEMPRSMDVTEGFFSRWVVLPFEVGYFPSGKADPGIEDKLHDPEELQGLLVRASEALRNVIGRNSFSNPPTVQKATRQFRVAADPVREFVEECLTAKPTSWLPRTDLYNAYLRWAGEAGVAEIPARTLYAQLRSGAVRDVLGVDLQALKRRGAEGFKGVAIT